MSLLELLYLVFAVAHPVSEMVRGTSLQAFLNQRYYKTGRENHPVKKWAGIDGSLLVLVLLVIPLFFPGWLLLALGLAAADLIQHARHFASRPRDVAPQVHLVTIFGVLVFLVLIILDQKTFDWYDLWKLIPGALIIFGYWFLNSKKAKAGSSAPLGRPAKSA